jgi:CubicO group peptidase (beta-lactamase class C family)
MLSDLLVGCSVASKPRSRSASPSAGDSTDVAVPGQSACETASEDWPMLPSLNDTIRQKMAQGHLPGLAACIIKDGNIAWCGAYGSRTPDEGAPVTTDTPFLWASVSKLVTATAVGMLAESGQLSLDSGVDQHLAYSIVHPSAPRETLSTEAVLAHAGGIADNDSVMDTYVRRNRDPSLSLAEVAERYFSVDGADYSSRMNFLGNGPERRSAYSNMGYALLGHQVEAATGTDFSEWTDSAIFTPLGMNQTGWHLADFDVATLAEPMAWRNGQYVPQGHVTFADYPNGGLRSSVHDMGCFLAMASRGGSLYGVEVLEKDSLVDMMRPAFPSLDRDQALGWYYQDMGDDELWIGHSGGESGVAADLFMRQDGSLGIVLVANGDWGNERAIVDIEDALVASAKALP